MTALAPVIEALAARGLDLAAPLAVADYDAAVPALPLPPVGRCALVVGNTRALWPVFVKARRDEAHPLDAYVERAVTEVMEASGLAWAVRWAHTMPATVAIQRAAAIAGLAYLAPSHLCVHAVYGPWIALRAVVVIDAEPPPRAVPVAPPCDCARGCLPAFERAVAAGVPGGRAELIEKWRLWLAVRDACPVGRNHRYGDDQISFHYAGVDGG